MGAMPPLLLAVTSGHVFLTLETLLMETRDHGHPISKVRYMFFEKKKGVLGSEAGQGDVAMCSFNAGTNLSRLRKTSGKEEATPAILQVWCETFQTILSSQAQPKSETVSNPLVPV